MIILTDRCRNILNELLNNKRSTLDSLEKTIKVSKRTISKDLELIDQFIKKYNAKLIRKPRVGIWIEGEQETLVNLKSLVKVKKHSVPTSPEERKIYIIVRLINDKKYITIQDLADEMYVSKGTVSNDLIRVENYLNQKDVEIEKKQNRGMKIKGSEENLRRIYAEVLSKGYDVNYILKLIDSKNNLNESEYINQFLNEDVLKLFEKGEISRLRDIIKKTEKELGYDFSDAAFVALLIHIAIAIKRIKNGNEISIDKKILEKLQECNEYDIATKLIDRIEQEFRIKIPKEESGYITMHILGSKVKNFNFGSQDIIDSLISDTELEKVVKNMLSIIENVTGIDFINDKDLFKGLMFHIRPSINRLVNNMPIKNPYTKEIKIKYPLSFESAVQAYEVLMKKYNVKANEDEIAYIAIHIEAALERNKQFKKDKIKALIACSTGIGTSQLVTAKIKSVFSNIEVVEVVSVIDIHNREKYEGIDLIISTIPMYTQQIPVINVNPFLPQEDIDKISDFINYRHSGKQFKPNNNRLNLFDEELIIFEDENVTKEEVIRKMCLLLEQKEYINEKYYETVINREKIGATAYDRLAIPHGDFNEVIKPAIAVCVLKNKVEWNGNGVRVIFLICVNKSIKDSLSGIFENLNKLISNQEKINEILSIKDKDELIKLISNI